MITGHLGMLVVAAVGNLGQAPGHPVLPPASAPSALTVGGLDDRKNVVRLRDAVLGIPDATLLAVGDGPRRN